MTLAFIGILCAAAGWLLLPKGADRLRSMVSRHPERGSTERGSPERGSPAGGTAARGAVAGSRPTSNFRSGKRRSGGAEPVTIADLMDELSSMLRAGATHAEVFRQLQSLHAGDDQAEFTKVVAGQVALGEPASEAIRSALAAVSPVDRPAAAGLAAGWQVAAECGVPLADCITRYAASVRSDADARRAREAAMAGPRATVTVLTWLPAGGVGLGMLLGARPIETFTGSVAGWVCLIAGIGLLVLGRRWMAYLLARAGKPAGGRRP